MRVTGSSRPLADSSAPSHGRSINERLIVLLRDGAGAAGVEARPHFTRAIGDPRLVTQFVRERRRHNPRRRPAVSRSSICSLTFTFRHVFSASDGEYRAEAAAVVSEVKRRRLDAEVIREAGRLVVIRGPSEARRLVVIRGRFVRGQ